MLSSLKTVLLVDDGPNERILFEMAAKKAGTTFALRYVSDGREAVDYLEGVDGFRDRSRHPVPDLVVLDVNMPRMNGFEFLEWLRRHPVLQSLPVVMWTSSAQESDIRRAYSLLANSYLVKPLSLTALVEMGRLVEDYWLKLNHRPRIDAVAVAPASKAAGS